MVGPEELEAVMKRVRAEVDAAVVSVGSERIEMAERRIIDLEGMRDRLSLASSTMVSAPGAAGELAARISGAVAEGGE